jgi:hypothetical protein
MKILNIFVLIATFFSYNFALMSGRYRTRIVPPTMTLGERVARDKGVFPQANTGWDIPFRIYYSKEWLEGYLIPNQLRLMIGVPGTFLVFWDGRYRGTLSWTTDKWVIDGGIEQGLAEKLGEWVVLYYE